VGDCRNTYSGGDAGGRSQVGSAAQKISETYIATVRLKMAFKNLFPTSSQEKKPEE
jgi:hypothetical protein